MKQRRFLALPLLLIVFALLGCEQYDTQVGTPIAGQGDRGEIKEIRLPVVATRNWTEGDEPAKPLVPPILGAANGLRSEILLRYSDFSELGDTLLAVESVELTLTGKGYVDSLRFADRLGDSFSATLYRIDSDYDTSAITYDDIAGLTLVPLDTQLAGTGFGRDTVRYELDPATVTAWASNDSSRRSLLLRPDYSTASYLKKFAGLEQLTFDVIDEQELPILRIVCDYVDAGDTLRNQLVWLQPTEATWLATDTLDLTSASEARLYLGEGYVRRMMLYSDIDSLFRAYTGLPEPADFISVNRAELILHQDKQWQHAVGDSMRFTWQDLRTPWLGAEPDNITPGSISTIAWKVPEDTNAVRVNITPIVRIWNSFPDSNYGFWLRPEVEGRSLLRQSFYDIDAADSTLRPSLRLIYTDFSEEGGS